MKEIDVEDFWKDGDAWLLDDKYKRAQVAEIKQLLQLQLYTIPNKQWFVSTQKKKSLVCNTIY